VEPGGQDDDGGRKRTVEQALEDELQSAVELLTQEKIKEGFSHPEARRQVLIELGGVEQVKEEVHSIRSGMFLDTFAQHLPYTLRMLRKSPGFTAFAILTLALGIGANTAVFSVIENVMFRSLPFSWEDRIVRVYSTENGVRPSDQGGPSAMDMRDFARDNRTFEHMAVYDTWRNNVNFGNILPE
jgi:hypothetical protein